MTLVNFKTPSKTGDFNNLIENFYTPLPSLFRDDFQSPNLIRCVAVNINESENGYDLELVAPGFIKEDFKIDLAKKILTIRQKRILRRTKIKSRSAGSININPSNALLQLMKILIQKIYLHNILMVF